eukprot:GHVU01133168.1.p2 GENE.GHVU01133168.1~~GHVU01133168.1.p2  ORF type:complete len:115 (-),score=19.20 GHVU01133168.1:229-573(-)
MKRGRGGSAGSKLRVTLGLNVGAIINCCDNSGAKNLYIIAVKGVGSCLNRLPACSLGDVCLATVKKGKPELRCVYKREGGRKYSGSSERASERAGRQAGRQAAASERGTGRVSE